VIRVTMKEKHMAFVQQNVWQNSKKIQQRTSQKNNAA
jgi:hypothetical protein